MGPVGAADDLVLHELERRQGVRNRDEGRVEQRVEAFGNRARGDLGERRAVVACIEVVDVVEAQERAGWNPDKILQENGVDLEGTLQVDYQKMRMRRRCRAPGVPCRATIAVDR